MSSVWLPSMNIGWEEHLTPVVKTLSLLMEVLQGLILSIITQGKRNCFLYEA